MNGSHRLPLARLVPLALWLSLAACSTPSRDPGPPVARTTAPEAAPAQPAPEAKRAAVVVLTGSQGEHRVSVEVVSSPRAVERGLMYRQFMPVDDGMLFLMGDEEVQTFWMHNTLISLDMIFIDKDFKVVGVVENAEPRTDTPRSVGKPSTYVLEVNGGWSAKHGIGAGATARFDGVDTVVH